MKVTMQCNCLSAHSNIYTLTSSWAHTKRMIFNIYCTVQWQCVLDSVDRAQCVEIMVLVCRVDSPQYVDSAQSVVSTDPECR